MIAVIFEVHPRDAYRKEYFDLAANLHSSLAKIDGFISVERFESLTQPGKLLSLSFWRHEQSIAAWRTLGAHRAAPHKGRNHLFDDYRLRIAAVVRDYGMRERQE